VACFYGEKAADGVTAAHESVKETFMCKREICACKINLCTLQNKHICIVKETDLYVKKKDFYEGRLLSGVTAAHVKNE